MVSRDRKRIDHISKEEVLAELRRVALVFENKYFGRREFDQQSTVCKSTKVINGFGSWQEALQQIEISQQAVRKPRKDKVSDEELVKEIARVWQHLGHRPSKAEWESLNTRYGYTTIKQRFFGWTNACNEALLILNGANEIESLDGSRELASSETADSRRSRIPKEEKRNIPLRLRLKVLRRDQYKCVLCGRNPAADPGVELHIDHIVPFSLGGRTEESNLRTLCRECNVGRGNDQSF